MKALFVLLSLMVSFSAFAQRNPTWANTDKLNRIIEVTLPESSQKFAIVDSDGYTAYYDTAYDEVKMKITAEYTGKKLTVEILQDDVLYRAEVASGYERGEIAVKKLVVKKGKDIYSKNNRQMWSDIASEKEEGSSKIMLTSSLYGADPVEEELLVTGPMKFSPCDGCEHGDQLLIKNINVVQTKSLGEYYTADCEGEIKPLLEQLLEPFHKDEGLSVPFTYKGRVNIDTTDLLEEIGDLWMGTPGGQLYIGHTTYLPVARFLDSLVVRVAAKLGVEAYILWDNIVEEGKFSYSGDVLTFKYSKVELKTDLRTARDL